MSEAARSPRLDPQTGIRPLPAPGSGLDPDFDDPLAELARLVGQDDPFRNLFRGEAKADRAAAPPPPAQPRTAVDFQTRLRPFAPERGATPLGSMPQAPDPLARTSDHGRDIVPQGTLYAPEPRRDANGGYAGEAGYEPETAYESEAGYEPEPVYESEAGYADEAAGHESEAGYADGAGYETGGGHHPQAFDAGAPRQLSEAALRHFADPDASHLGLRPGLGGFAVPREEAETDFGTSHPPEANAYLGEFDHSPMGQAGETGDYAAEDGAFDGSLRSEAGFEHGVHLDAEDLQALRHEDLLEDGFAAPPLAPDRWAESGDIGASAMADSPAVEAPKTTRRPLVVLVAVLLLTGGGLLAATFLTKGSAGSVASGHQAPTILAAVDPDKVRLAASPSASSASDDADAALLNKNGAPNPTPPKVMDSQEQPIDLGQLPKSTATAADTGSASSPFPQPKKVKTFLVRADGSVMGDSAAPLPSPATTVPKPVAPQVPATPVLPSIASIGMPLESSSAPTPRAATPKTTARAVTTPKAASEAQNADVAPTPGTAAKVRQPAAPTVHARPKPKPKTVETAEADPAAETPADPTATTEASAKPEAPAVTPAGGGFGVQIAASPNEQDARDAFARLQRKFPDQLGSLRATVRRADNGEKTVYRVRVGNLNQEEAKTLCAQLQASGGSCFVVH